MTDEIPLWRQPLARSLYKTRNSPESRYVQMATISLKGRPRNRTLVFRGFDEQSQLCFISDSRTQKWTELKKKPYVSICWYFASTREQYRLEGKAELLTKANEEHTSLIQHYWSNLSVAAKKQFLWGEPGEKRNKEDLLSVEKEAIPEEAPEHFIIMVVTVGEVDYLNLKGTPQERYHYKQSSNGWREIPIIP